MLDRGPLVGSRYLLADARRLVLARPHRLVVLPQRDDDDRPGLPVGEEDDAPHALRLPGLGRQHVLLLLQVLVDGLGRRALVSRHTGMHVDLLSARNLARSPDPNRGGRVKQWRSQASSAELDCRRRSRSWPRATGMRSSSAVATTG